jgi:hypothetical protein
LFFFRLVAEYEDGIPNGYGVLYSDESTVIQQGYWNDGYYIGLKQFIIF